MFCFIQSVATIFINKINLDKIAIRSGRSLMLNWFRSLNMELLNILPRIKNFLSESFKLSLHPDKVFIKTITSGVDFLGWVHFPYHRVLRTTTKRRMFKNLKNNSKPTTIQSYLGMLKHGNAYKLKEKFT